MIFAAKCSAKGVRKLLSQRDRLHKGFSAALPVLTGLLLVSSGSHLGAQGSPSVSQAPVSAIPAPPVISTQPPTNPIAPPSKISARPIPPGMATSTPTLSPGGASPAFEVFSDYNWGNAMAEKLRNAPAKLYEFDRASLRDVLRFLADDAGIPFVALQESSAAENTLVTFTLKSSPFLALETVAKANGVSLFYENGVWFMRPINEKELIGRIYKIKYNSQETVKYQGDGSQSGATTSASSGGSTGSGVPQMNVNIQGASQVFEVEAPKIVDEIKSLLGIPTSSVSALMAGEASVENFGGMVPPSIVSPTGSSLIGTPEKAATASGDGGPQVIYNSDTATIYVVATRQQHQWVEGFLSAVDRPQALIGIEVKFFETTKDPSKELGINWAGTMAGGYNVGIQDITATPNGSINISGNQPVISGTNGGTITGTNGGGVVFGQSNAFNATITAAAPYSAVLTAGDVNVALQAFLNDLDTTTVQYPRVLTINNREVVIRSVINQPVLAATSSVTPGVGGTSTASVSYLPIGTIINVLPKTMPDDSVVLNVAITVSSIVGTSIIQGNAYPIASSRIYNAALQVDSGYTLAVGGLEEAFDQSQRNGIPFLRDIPGVGELFKSKNKARSKRNLIIFITPTIIHNRMNSPGIAEIPQSVIPVRPNEPLPPAFTPTGRLVGGYASIDEAGRWLERQILYYRQVFTDRRVDKESLKQLDGVVNTAEMLIAEIQLLENQMPNELDALIKKEERCLTIVEELNKIYSKSKKELMSY